MPTDPCPPQSDLQKKAADLADKGRQQNASDAKVALVALTAVTSDVDKAEAGYKKDYDRLSLALGDATQYEATREARVTALLQPGETGQIGKIADAVQNDIACNKTLADKAAQACQAAQAANAAAQAAVPPVEVPYRAALAYNDNFTALAALQARVDKEFTAGNYRGTYALLREMKSQLQKMQPLLTVDAYNKDLEAKALAYSNAADAARQTKATLDQSCADAQTAKKAYDDSVAKKIDTLLKAIGDTKFVAVPPVAPAVPAVAPAAPQGGPTTQPG